MIRKISLPNLRQALKETFKKHFPEWKIRKVTYNRNSDILEIKLRSNDIKEYYHLFIDYGFFLCGITFGDESEAGMFEGNDEFCEEIEEYEDDIIDEPESLTAILEALDYIEEYPVHIIIS